MNKLIVAAAIMLCATAAQAQTTWRQNQVGPFTYYSGQDEQGREQWSGQSSRVGPFTNYDYQNSEGQHVICHQSTTGSYTYTTCN